MATNEVEVRHGNYQIGIDSNLGIRVIGFAHAPCGAYMAKNVLVGGLFVATTTQAKAIITNLRTTTRTTKNTSWIKVVGLMEEAHITHEYHVTATQLPDFATWLIACRTKSPEFLFGDTVQAVGEYLMGPSFTTPILPQWIPSITEHLRRNNYIRQCTSIGVQCSWLKIKQDQLDLIVSNLVKERKLRFVSSGKRKANGSVTKSISRALGSMSASS